MLLVLLYARILAGLAEDWLRIPAFSHGPVIVALAIVIAWRDRRRISQLPTCGDNRGLGLTALACLLYAAGQLGAEFFLQRVSLVVLTAGLILTFWGPRRLSRLVLPLLLFATTIPLPAVLYNRLAAPLQLVSSDLATGIVQELGVSAYRDGNIISLAHITLGVAEACSGLNSLSALIVGAVLLGFLHFERALPRVMLVLSVGPLSILVNVARVAGTALLADSHPQTALGLFHVFSGWLVFCLGFSSLYIVSMALARVPRWRPLRDR
jgi:exosortase